jgi:hypothetical protein
MTAQTIESKKGNRKWANALIPTSLLMGFGVGWALNQLITKKTTVTQKRIAAERSQSTSHNKIREATLAIDHGLSVINDAKDRKVLVDAAYRLRDLDLSMQFQTPPRSPN